MSFTHVVTFKWTDASRHGQPLAEALRSFIATIEGVQSYHCGPDVGITPGAYDFAVAATFTDRDAFVAYRDHPEHRRIINEMITPHMEAKTVVQLEQ